MRGCVRRGREGVCEEGVRGVKERARDSMPDGKEGNGCGGGEGKGRELGGGGYRCEMRMQ